jgi:endonuclease/exonuclease/phosphatase family metal-dependent hydrolase
MERIAEINPESLPVVLMGDFNMKPSAPELKDVDARMSSARKVALKTDNHNTFNGWGKADKDMVIDYIYISGFSSCPEYRTVTGKYADRKFVSDHYPVFARLIF